VAGAARRVVVVVGAGRLVAGGRGAVVEVATAVVVDVASPSPAVVDVIDVEDGADEVDVDDEVAPAALMVGFPPQLVAKPATTTTAIRAGTRRLDKDGDIVVVSAHCDGLLRGAATTFAPTRHNRADQH
jgi:hypothetical protein